MPEGPLIHIIDDDESLRDALHRLFRSTGQDSCRYGSVAEFLDGADPGRRGCLVLDVRLPGVSGLEFQSQMVQSGVRMPVVMITGHGDIPMSVRAMKAGAVDFLTKPFRDQDLLDAVAAALARDLESRRLQNEASALAGRYASLSRREKQVMALVTRGLLNKQVAAELDLSEVTVKIHRGAAMRKMEAASLAELVRMADALDLDREAR